MQRLICVLAFALLATACRTTPRPPAFRAEAPALAQADTVCGNVTTGVTTNVTTAGPTRTDFAPTRSGERRYTRALTRYYKAQEGPRKLAAGAVYAPANDGSITATTAVGKNAQAATADSGATIAQARKVGAQAAGDGATATAERGSRIPWWWWLFAAVPAYFTFRRLTA